MTTSLLSAPPTIALLGAFGAAGALKLTRPDGVRRALARMHVPVRLLALAAAALGALELLVAAGLLFHRTWALSAAVALAMLIAFSAFLLIEMRRPASEDCGCFGGQLEVSPRRGLIRNAALVACAVTVLIVSANNAARGGLIHDLSRVRLSGSPVLAEVSLTVSLLCLVALVFVLGQNGRLLDRVDALERRQPPVSTDSGAAPVVPSPGHLLAPVELSTTDGRVVHVAGRESAGAATWLVIVSVTCGPCRDLLARWSGRALRADLTIVCVGDADRVAAQAEDYGLELAIAGVDLMPRLGVGATPVAIRILPDSTVGDEPLVGVEDIDRVLGGESVRALLPLTAAD